MVAARLVRVAGQVGQRGDAVERLGADDGHPDIPRPAGDDGPGPHHIPDTLQRLHRVRDGVGGPRPVLALVFRLGPAVIPGLRSIALRRVDGLRRRRFDLRPLPPDPQRGSHDRPLRHRQGGQPFPVLVVAMDGQRDGGPDVALGDQVPEPTGLGVIGRIGQALK